MLDSGSADPRTPTLVAAPAPAPPPITVVLADDYPRYRDGIARAIARRPPLSLVAEVEDGISALEAILRLRPDVALLDMRMPGMTGLEVVDALRSRGDAPATRLVLMTADVDDDHGQALVAAGGDLLLDKSMTRAAVCAALLDVARPPADA
ncbi:response regulator [Patulibacter defluvii]|uniref:response regulator n=1 Tax=Patulibacter defluvii TaxID=3095358 RepID=UPI002A7588C0|nr:response regulator transcription factor [Patulibacter sp. DM4]